MPEAAVFTVQITDAVGPEKPLGWTLSSFSKKHASYEDPRKLGFGGLNGNGTPNILRQSLRQRLTNGSAFLLSYFEHGNCWWGRANGRIPAGVEFTWDGVRYAGLLLCDNARALPRGFAARCKVADKFLAQYSDWCNGNAYEIVYTDTHGHTVVDGPWFACDSRELGEYIWRLAAGRQTRFTGSASWVMHGYAKTQEK